MNNTFYVTFDFREQFHFYSSEDSLKQTFYCKYLTVCNFQIHSLLYFFSDKATLRLDSVQ